MYYFKLTKKELVFLLLFNVLLWLIYFSSTLAMMKPNNIPGRILPDDTTILYFVMSSGAEFIIVTENPRGKTKTWNKNLQGDIQVSSTDTQDPIYQSSQHDRQQSFNHWLHRYQHG